MAINSRLTLHAALVDFIGSDNVYFQPPESISLSYPCIIYARSDAVQFWSDNQLYALSLTYDVTIIDTDSDSGLAEKFASFPRASFDRHYTADNLSHDNFKVSVITTNCS